MKTFAVLLFLNLVASVSFATALDLATHDSLIQKLESAVGTDTSDAMLLQTNMAYRLAGLYAERARLLSMEQEGRGEQINAQKITVDRKKSISILQKILKSLDNKTKGPAQLQIAHLQSLQGNSKGALAIYKQIEKDPKKYDGKTIALVEIQLGDQAFAQGEMPSAKNHFAKAAQYKENPRQGYTQFRIAWVNYSQGQFILAEKQMIQLLSDSKNFTSAAGDIDTSFQEEASHDLALFMAKNKITDQSLQGLIKLGPESARKKNLMFLATELDRTAQKVAALKVWKLIGGSEITFNDQLDRQIQVTRIEYDLGHKKGIIEELQRSLALLKSEPCAKNEECVIATQNLRRVLTDWAKAEERDPSAELITSFQLFVMSIDDAEMAYWGATAAYNHKQFATAFKFYERTVSLLQNNNKKTAAQMKMFEGALLGAIEVAELSKNPELRLQAYQKYLTVNPQGAKSNEVRYQVAHWYYEQNNYSKASEDFLAIAKDAKMPTDLREKAGDLSLDSEVVMKNELSIETRALLLAQTLPAKKSEYLTVYRKSVINQSANILNQSQTALYSEHFKKLDSMNLALFSPMEAKQIVKNKIELAYRQQEIETLGKNAKLLLAFKSLTTEEKSLALHHLSWIAELKMNFKEALSLLVQMKPAPKLMADYYLKMATLKELSNENPTQSYENYIAVAKDTDKKAFAAHQIVLFARAPMAAFKKYESILKRNQSLYASAGIFVFEKSNSVELSKSLMAKKSFRNSFYGQLLSHDSAMKDLIKFQREISKTEIKSRSDRELKRAILARQAAIKKLEVLANKAITGKDTSMQLIYLTSVSEQNSRLANELLALPPPRGMKKAEKVEYKQQVQALVTPYQLQASNIKQKTTELWKQAITQNSFQLLGETAFTKNKPGHRLASEEVAYLRASARRTGLAVDPFEKFSEQQQKTLSEADSLKMKLQVDPFNLNDLAKLKILQTSLGRGPMVAYLDYRMAALQVKRGTH